MSEMGGCGVKHFGSRVPTESGHLFLSDLHGEGEERSMGE